MGDESLGRESNINFTYMRELPLVGMDLGSVGSVACCTWSPAETLPGTTACPSHLETKDKNTILLHKPSEFGISKMKSRELGMGWLPAVPCVSPLPSLVVWSYLLQPGVPETRKI